MTQAQQPPALHYAKTLECMDHKGCRKAAAELRRLHALEAQSQRTQQPKDCQRPECMSHGCFGHCLKKASAP